MLFSKPVNKKKRRSRMHGVNERGSGVRELKDPLRKRKGGTLCSTEEEGYNARNDNSSGEKKKRFSGGV